MLKLFRNIRQNLMNEGKTTRYLKYAISEIVLVVIGILIALGINNLRDHQKENILELTILDQIKGRLETDSLAIQEMVDYMKVLRNMTINLKTYMKEDKPYIDTLKTSFSQMSFLPVYNPDETSFERLHDAGINIVKNDSLRNLIPSYFMNIAQISEVSEEFPLSSYFRNEIYPKYFKSFSWNPKVGCEPKNYEILKNADDFFIALDYVINDTQFYMRRYLGGAKQNAHLLNVLRHELKKRKK